MIGSTLATYSQLSLIVMSCRICERLRLGIVIAPRKNLLLSSLLVGLAIAISLCLIGAAVTKGQTELIDKVEILEDPTAALTVGQIDMKAFHPANRVIIEGYTNSAFWIRLHVREVSGEQYYKLSVRPTDLDEITLYVPDAAQPDGWRAIHAGGLNRVVDAQKPSSLRAFRINPAVDGGVYLVRVASMGALGIKVSALVEFEAERQSLRADLSQISYLCLMLALMIWAMRLAFVTDEPLLWLYGATQAAWITHNAIHFGYADVFIPNSIAPQVHMANRGLVILASFLTLMLHTAMLGRFSPPRSSLLLLRAILGIVILSIVLFVFGKFSPALELNAVAMLVAPVCFLINAFTARKSPPPGLITLRVIYSLFNLVLFAWILTLVGLLQSDTYAQWALMIYGLASGLLMGSFLNAISKHRLAEAEQAQLSNLQLKERSRVEQAQNQTLTRFIDMLTHETKNAMAVINMSASAPNFGQRQRDRVSAAISGLTSVIDRCSQSLRMDMQDEVVTPELCDPAGILRDLCQTNPLAARIKLTAQQEAWLHSDPALLRVIFANLIENALKYSPPQSVVHVIMQPAAMSQQLIWFENEEGAAGLPDPVHVFEKYYRSNRAMVQIGSGLGLYLVQGLVRNLGGGISYEPKEGRARFRLWLPC